MTSRSPSDDIAVLPPVGGDRATTRGERPVICILVLAPIVDDPRVRRQCDAFHRAGWEVVGVGLAGGRSDPPEWRVVTPHPPVDAAAAAAASPSPGEKAAGPPRRGGAARLIGALRRRLRLLAVRLWPRLALVVYWDYSSNIRDIYGCARRIKAAVWLANDWSMLPCAARLAQEEGGIYGYDTHEFAVEEYAEKPKWRLVHRPLVAALENAFIRNAAIVSAVSEGIAERLDQRYRLPQRSMTVRNTPAYEAVSFRPTGERIRVLYHGLVAIGRGLEQAIDSVTAWRPEFDLTIRGPGDLAYVDELRQRIERSGIAGRVSLVPPVAMTALVREAAAFDIGFFALPGHSRHNEFALPNKFFEYVMAGLALCVSELPEMARLVRQYDLGVTIPRVLPGDIAAAINRLDRAFIDRCKRRALVAARELCWERESGRLVAAYATAIEQVAR